MIQRLLRMRRDHQEYLALCREANLRYQRKYLAKLKRCARDLFGNKCNTCGTPNEPLQFAHLTPTKLSGRGRGKRRRYLDVLRNPHAYILECFDCHYRRDHGSDDSAEPF